MSFPCNFMRFCYHMLMCSFFRDLVAIKFPVSPIGHWQDMWLECNCHLVGCSRLSSLLSMITRQTCCTSCHLSNLLQMLSQISSVTSGFSAGLSEEAWLRVAGRPTTTGWHYEIWKYCQSTSKVHA